MPVINVEAIRNRKDSAKDDIFYLCSFSGLIIESNQFEQYIQSIDLKIENLKNEIFSSEDRIHDLNRDLLKVSAFLENYTEEKVQEVSAGTQNIRKHLKDLNGTVSQKIRE